MVEPWYTDWTLNQQKSHDKLINVIQNIIYIIIMELIEHTFALMLNTKFYTM